jgi:hypothetical protein
MLVMQSNPAWGDRAVGVTDPLHNAIAINPVTLEEDAQSGSVIYPKHVHKALRKLLNLEGNNLDQQFPFSNTESMAFFG